jgi:hypothetical protein
MILKTLTANSRKVDTICNDESFTITKKISPVIDQSIINNNEIRFNKEKNMSYKVIQFNPYCLINHQKTWDIKYENGDKFSRPEVSILNDNKLKS